jgi:hypothetical protein
MLEATLLIDKWLMLFQQLPSFGSIDELKIAKFNKETMIKRVSDTPHSELATARLNHLLRADAGQKI